MQNVIKLVKKSFSTLVLKPHRSMQIVPSVIAALVLISLGITTMLVETTPALAAPIFTSSDQDQAISSFISAFYDPTNHFFYTDTQNHAEADLWTEAIDWSIVMDAYSRTKNTTYNQMIGDIFNHITSVNGTNCGQWQANASNQTLAWWAETSLQAYTITNNTTYRDCAKGLFDKVYQSWDTTQAGGGIWTFNNQTSQKSMATNALAVMTAAQLSTILGDTSYLSKAQGIYNWIRSHLTNLTGTSGAVYDRYDSVSNTVIMNQFSDNYGVFIGAALGLNDATKNNSSAANNQSVNYLADANNVANASLSNVTVSGDGIIQYESDCNNNTSAGDTSNSNSGNNGNIVNNGSFVNQNNTCNGGLNERALYKGIYAHYLADLAFNSNYAVSQSAAYGQVLDENAALAWSDRLPSSNLVGPDWAEPAPTGPIKSWEAAPAVEILQVLPNNNNIATYQSQDATLQGGLILSTQFAGYMSNSGYISSGTQDGQSASFTVSAPAAGTELLIIRYSAGSGNAVRYLQVNGNQNTANFPTGPIYASGSSNSVISQISFPGTNSWDTYDLDVIPALLNQGNNTITISFTSSQGSQNALNLDELTVTLGFPPASIGASSNSSTATPSASTIVSSASTTTSYTNTIASNTSSSTGTSGSNTGKCGNESPVHSERGDRDYRRDEDAHTAKKDEDSHTAKQGEDAHTTKKDEDSHAAKRDEDSHTSWWPIHIRIPWTPTPTPTPTHTPTKDIHTHNEPVPSHKSKEDEDPHTPTPTHMPTKDIHTHNEPLSSHKSKEDEDPHKLTPTPTPTPTATPTPTS